MCLWCLAANLALFFFLTSCRQSRVNWVEICKEQLREKQWSPGLQLKWTGPLEPAQALGQGLCPSTEVRALESQLGDREGRMPPVVGWWKPPLLRLRKEGAVVSGSNHRLPSQPNRRQGHLVAKEVLIFQTRSFGILTGCCIFSIAGEIWTPKGMNLSSR